MHCKVSQVLAHFNDTTLLYLFRVYQTGQESSYVEDESGMDASEDGSGEDGSSFGAGMCSLFLTSLELLYFSQFISVSYSRNEFCTNQESQIALEEPNHKCAQRCIKKWASGFRHRFESSYEHIHEDLSSDDVT